MKKIIALMLSVILLLSCVSFAAEETRYACDAEAITEMLQYFTGEEFTAEYGNTPWFELEDMRIYISTFMLISTIASSEVQSTNDMANELLVAAVDTADTGLMYLSKVEDTISLYIISSGKLYCMRYESANEASLYMLPPATVEVTDADTATSYLTGTLNLAEGSFYPMDSMTVLTLLYYLINGSEAA